ncbi:MAG: hypothetical protein C4536_10800 [Actinobacteria bacterium]|jgi:hypothetical protein|nr:MAG: hypothetical protein C4536_10800 [Actinomycetota bacterium]
MNKTIWKSSAEIQHALKGARKVAVFSCGWCANLSEAGGLKGMDYLAGLLRGWGKEVVMQRCFILCCSHEGMAQAMRIYKDRLEESDALVILSCSAGLKSAFLCRPPVRIVAATDMVGSVPVTWVDDPVASSACISCGNCVIAFTGGICPLGRCPAREKYGPCPDFYTGRMECAQDPQRACIWSEIERRGDLAALRELAALHAEHGEDRLSSPSHKATASWMRKTAGRIVAGVRGLPRMVPFLK